jgi:hypothetical protein
MAQPLFALHPMLRFDCRIRKEALDLELAVAAWSAALLRPRPPNNANPATPLAIRARREMHPA